MTYFPEGAYPREFGNMENEGSALEYNVYVPEFFYAFMAGNTGSIIFPPEPI